ncbi:LysR family transcriptional regulator [Vibrio rhizosphaerae]|uniref:LysR family transcriptional regulator n=1 Tax=Vibrio rhizosphaerae TaxID=398736 RepID=A0ABU4IU33_9VIBR|nr:LysR family transcriptional regulator [Vibrio rhizosphaerae]MDW6092840.1 LysR family transcriptional regulator [Vibrio rhizosphaerae]
MNNINWDDLKYFLALYETGKVSTAAHRLNVNYATVSRRLDRLEDALKLKLFNRTGDGFLSTIEGKLLYERSVNLRDQINHLSESLSPDTRFDQSTKISMVPFLAEHLVIEKLKPLHSRFPELRFEMDTSSRNVNIAKQEADIALRMELPEKGESICKKLGEVEFVLSGTDDWIARLRNHEPVHIVTYTAELSHLPECQYLIERFGTKSIKIQTDTVSAQRKAAEQGYGIALLPKIALRSSPLSTLKPETAITREIWLLTTKKTMSSTAKKLVMEELVKIFNHELQSES